jgi:deazaflavin-dependent oxidoreductase (nitroreductase family)
MPKFIWRMMTIGPRTLYKLGLGWVIGGRILLLTTTGRKSGMARTTPLQYERHQEKYVIGSARGLKADWVQNLLKDEKVSIQVGRRKEHAVGQVVTDHESVADFMQQRYANHPLFIGLLLRLQGYQGELDREVFLGYAQNRVMVILNPVLGDGV